MRARRDDPQGQCPECFHSFSEHGPFRCNHIDGTELPICPPSSPPILSQCDCRAEVPLWARC